MRYDSQYIRGVAAAGGPGSPGGRVPRPPAMTVRQPPGGVAWLRLGAPERGGAGPPPPCDGGPSRGGRNVAAFWGPQIGVHCLWYFR